MTTEVTTTIPTIEQRIQRIVSEHLGVKLEDVKPEASFESLGADSLDTLEIVMTIEDEFGIEIPDAEAEQLTTLAKACELVDKLTRLAKGQQR